MKIVPGQLNAFEAGAGEKTMLLEGGKSGKERQRQSTEAVVLPRQR